MIHPSDQAIDYIWQHFSSSYMDDKTSDFLKKWGEIRRSLNHRPFNPNTPEHQKFLQSTLKELHLLSNQINLSKEIDQINKQIIDN
jgi:hypothetical protein